jgi:pseudouridine-5'-phosphate glycosidase
MEIVEEVRRALSEGGPVVALESTVIAHGLPAPRNLEVGAELEAIVRDAGAVPATIAVLDGKAHVGLSDRQMERIATEPDVLKLSTRDLPLALAREATGATTVAATAWLASRAGIQVFATGGIGGVHRGEPKDVSADLAELGRTPILVVCAGAKSILDLPATREALESAGVLCLGWKTRQFPAFYSGESGLQVDAEVSDEQDVAAIWRAAREAGLPGGMLLCVPPPSEAALPRAVIDAAIDLALEEARASEISGREVTPFLLNAVARETGGRALTANISLLRMNASVAAKVAVAIASS